MSKGKRGINCGKQGTRESQSVTRRQFLKEASLVVGGAAIISLVFTSACGSPKNTTTSNTTTTTSTNATTSTNTNSLSTSTSTWSGVYIPPLQWPERLPIPGCENETTVATDRMYSAEHMWVKSITDDIVVVGITEKFLALLEVVYFVTLLDEGTMVYRDLYLSSIEAGKMNVELVAPVSGTVLQNNDELRNDPDSTINHTPYVRGWMQVIKLSKPEELKELLTPDEYISMNAKIIVN